MGDRNGWSAAETSRFLRAWAQAAAECAPRRASSSVLFRHLQQLSSAAGGVRSEKSVQGRRVALINMHTIVCAYNARTTSDSMQQQDSGDARSSSNSSSSEDTRSSPWFQLAEHEQRRLFAEINQKVASAYVSLTPEQFDAVSAIESMVVVGSVDAPSSNALKKPAEQLAGRVVKWTSDDTALLLRAWADVTTESAPKKAAARAVARRFEQLSEGGKSGRSLVSVAQWYSIFQNMHAVICLHDAQVSEDAAHLRRSTACRWFDLPDAERRKFFAKSSKVAWLKFVDLSEVQFAAISAIDNILASASEEAIADGEGLVPANDPPAANVPLLKTAAEASDNLLAPRTLWSEDDTMVLLRAWAMARTETECAHPTALEVTQKYKELSNGTGKQAAESATCLKHFVVHNIYTIISTYNAKFDKPALGPNRPSQKPKWFSLTDDERRTVFASMNMNLTYWYMDFSEDHFNFISDTRKNDGFEGNTKRRYARKQGRKTWTSDHTTAILYAWERAIAQSCSNKPATNVIYNQFVQASGGTGGSEKAFMDRFSSLRFMHSIITAYVEQNTRERARVTASGQDETNSVCSSQSMASINSALNDWFDLLSVDRRKYFDGAGGKKHVYTDLTREQFNILARIMAGRAASEPAGGIKRAAGPRDSGEREDGEKNGTVSYNSSHSSSKEDANEGAVMHTGGGLSNSTPGRNQTQSTANAGPQQHKRQRKESLGTNIF